MPKTELTAASHGSNKPSPAKSVYVIGDLQGCLGPLEQLLTSINYDPSRITLWFAGDLVNRGPQSLETLRFVRQLPEDTITVLGNHDLSLLVDADKGKLSDPLHPLYPIYQAPDRSELLEWLRHRPLLHHDPHHQFTLTHAGIYPAWSLIEAKAYAREFETALQGPHYAELLRSLWGNEPLRWDHHLQHVDRLRFILNTFTRMRFCEPLTSLSTYPTLNLRANGAPEDHAALIPWFDVLHRPLCNEDLIFGHWSALEANQKCKTPHIYPIDSGCVWGNCLTAFCLNTREYSQIPCKPYLNSPF